MASRKILKVMQNARQGDAPAQLELGRCYLEGAEGLGRNLAAAYHWLAAAAERGDGEAARLIGEHIPAGVVDSPLRARRHFETARELGSLRAATMLAKWQLEGVFGPLTAAEDAACRNTLRDAARRGDVLAQLTVGALALDRDADRDDVLWLAEAARQGEATAARRLIDFLWERAGGDLWATGQIPGERQASRTPQQLADAREALFWHRDYWNANSGEMPVGEMRRRGSLLLLERHKEAGKWLEKAANAGDGIAAYLLGVSFMGPAYLDALLGGEAGSTPAAGHRFPRSYKQAEAWLTRAAEMHIAEAGFGVWMLNNLRNYTLKDPAKGNRYLRHAARMGHAEACWLLARASLAKDELPEAVRWLERAVVQGLAKAERQLDELAPRVSSPDSRLLALAQALAEHDSRLAARLELGARFALKEAEYLLLDPNAADLGGVLCVDIRRHYGKAKMRLIRISDERQRAALSRAKQLLAGTEADATVAYQNLKRRAQGKIARLANLPRPASPAKPAFRLESGHYC